MLFGVNKYSLYQIALYIYTYVYLHQAEDRGHPHRFPLNEVH